MSAVPVDASTPAPQPAVEDTGDRPFQTVWETDHRGASHYQSPSWYRYIGDGFGSSFGEDWLQYYHPEDRQRLQEEWQNCLADPGRRYDLLARIRRHDGEYRWFRIQGAPQFGADGSVLKWSGTCTDIHDQVLSGTLPAQRGETPSETPPAPQRRFRFGPLEWRIFGTVMAGLLPLALLAFVTLFEYARHEREQRIAANIDTMRAVITAVDGEISKALAALDALAASPRLASHDFAGFRAEARELLARRPGFANLVLSTPEARQVMNAALPDGAPLPSRVEPAAIEAAVRTGQPGVGNVILSPVLQRHGFAAFMPIRERGEVAYVLVAVIKPEAIRDILQRQRVPEDSVISIVDRNYNIVARSMRHEASVGRPAAALYVATLKKSGPAGWARSLTLEGREVYSAFQRSEFTGWTAGIGIPVEVLDDPVRRSYMALGAAILASMAAGLVVALFVARSLTRPMRELEDAAIAVGQGATPVEPQTALPELRRAGAALVAAHAEREKLLQSEREARLLEQHARRQAEDAGRAKDEFLAMLGHELRNPLAAISAASDILDHAERMRSPESVQVAKDVIRRQSRHLARMTDDLLDAGRVMMGKINLERRPLNLATVVRSAIESLRGAGRFDAHRLEVDVADCRVEGDATRLEQIVTNLLSNAAKYTPAGGRIDVRLAQAEGEAVLRVSDSGLGLEPELLPRVFDLFVQGKRSIDRAQGGLGIGLTLVRRLAELHGGRVEARSEGEGHGSEFTVRLPLTEREGDLPPLPGRPPGGPRVVVLVEDNDDVRTSLRHILEIAGHRVLDAADGPSGLALILREHADVALVDIGLPGLDGYGVAAEVRRQSAYAVHLVALTGYGSPEDKERGLQAGFDAYLVKPVDTALLLDLVAAA